MRALLKAKTRKSSAKKKPAGGVFALKQQRGTYQRSFVVRNKVKRNGVVIAPQAPVFQMKKQSFAFELEDRMSLFFLPTLGYVGGRPEAEKIRSRVVADNMTQKEIDRIALAVEKRLIGTFATKAELAPLATTAELKAQLAPLATTADVNSHFAGVTSRFDGLDLSLASLRQLVVDSTTAASKADPRPS
jgi:hypothetical protein